MIRPHKILTSSNYRDDKALNSETLDHDPHDDPEYTPRIAILGAGPIGLEAALYARYLGLDVAVLEAATVAANVLDWGHVSMFSPFSMNRSPLGVAAVQTQFEEDALPCPDAILTGREYAERYLIPLAKTDLLAGCIHEQTHVLGIGRDGILKSDKLEEARAQFAFRILVDTAEGQDCVEADFVIDTTGVFNQPNHLGHGGLPAMGEHQGDTPSGVFHGVPDILGKHRKQFDGRRILVVGSGYSAATNIVALSELKKSVPGTQITWLMRREAASDGPLPAHEDDPLTERRTLEQNANAMVASGDVVLADQSAVLEISHDSAGAVTAVLGGKVSGEHTFDTVINSTGFRPNLSLSEELQVEWCPATSAPAELGRWIHEMGPTDALAQTTPSCDVIRTTEPHFYVLGSKSFGRNSNFLIALGLQQIQQVFTEIAGREDLDLYKTMAKFA